LFRLTGLGHRNALPPDPSACGVQGFEEPEQNSGVMFAVGAAGQGCFVAGLLGEVGEAAVEPPGERAEPENRAMQKRQALSESVAAGEVRYLVRDDGVELGIVSLGPVGGQQNHGAQSAHGDRHGNQFGFGNLRNGGQAQSGGPRGQPLD
jgi:hypothetical protein